MQPFEHYTPYSLSEALSLLADPGDQRLVIAGGSDLLLQMQAGDLTPSALINIKRLPELKGISYEPDSGLRLGSLTTLRELHRSPIIREHYPVLSGTAGLMASEQIRCFATLGGNLCNGAPSADLAPPLIALQSEAIIVGQNGRRQVPLQDFFRGPGVTVLGPQDLLLEVIIPPARGEAIYMKHSQRAFMDIALVGVALQYQGVENAGHEARLVLGAVAPTPIRARQAEAELTGQPLTADRIQRIAEAAAEECSPIDDVRCSARYRRRMVAVLTRRILTGLMAATEAR